MSAVVVAVIAAVSSIVAAVVAGVFALLARRLDVRLQQSEKAQDQISERKRSIYEPVVELLDHMFTTDELPTSEEVQHKRRFDTWVNLYGSDGTVRAYSRLMQALPHDPPGDVQFRLYADFLLEVRKEIGNPGGSLDRMQILGPRLTNLSDRTSLTDPDLDAVFRRLGWSPPWRSHD